MVTALTALLAALTVLVGVGAPAALAAPPQHDPGPQIEPFAPYQAQRVCDPVARPGITAFRALMLDNYPGTGDYGIVRACTQGGTSEHKEGRAWDWKVSATDPLQFAQVQEALDWLLAPDAHGNDAAMARRLGLMYMIWNKRIWKSYQASRGWQSYTGSNPHTDHVHLSFGWAGAYGATSYWTGTVAPVMYAPVVLAPITVPGAGGIGLPVSATGTATVGDPVAAPATATATATVGVSAPRPVDPVAARRSRVLQQRAILATLWGPWRRRH